MCKKEKILLDAKLSDMIGNAAFVAILPNGHRIVAHTGPEGRGLKPGDGVRVELSPYNMSVGRIVLKEDEL